MLGKRGIAVFVTTLNTEHGVPSLCHDSGRHNGASNSTSDVQFQDFIANSLLHSLEGALINIIIIKMNN